MEIFTIYPILGIKDDVPADDPSMLKMLGQGVAEAHCADGRNIDFSHKRRACSKSTGRAQWSNSATSTTTYCLGIFELYDGSNRELFIFMGDGSSNGRVFRYDGSRDPVRISDVAGHSGATEFASGIGNYYSAIRFGAYMVFADDGYHTPYCCDANDTVVDKLISSGTEFKFKYLASFQRRIIGAYSDQSNGDLDIRWSNLLPTPITDCSFAAANQIYVPNDDPIIGVKRMGRDQCFIYCEESINRFNYLGSYNTPFGINTVIDGTGGTGNFNIVDIGNTHFFFNKDYGFCAFDGSNFVPVSDDIEETISTIPYTSYDSIIGCHMPYNNEIAWIAPVDGETSPNTILFYNYKQKIWRRKDVALRFIYPFQSQTSLTWSGLYALGYTTWEDFGDARWIELISGIDTLGMSNTDGHFYYDGTSSDNGSDFDGYRIEPILDFGLPEDKSLLLEIWFNIENSGNFSLYCYHRSGNTVGECKRANWTALSEVPCNSPANAVTYLAEVGRYHQIKWGTDGAGEAFSIHSIQFKYVRQGRY